MKSRLSIFSFNTLDIKFIKLFSLTTIVILVLFLLTEISLRIVIKDGQQPSGSWRNNELRVQAEQLEALNKVDIMFTGSSLAAANISPEAFDAEMQKFGYGIVSFNAGIRGCDYEGINVVFKEVFWKRKKSDYVVLIISPRDLDEANTGVRKRSQSFVTSVLRPGYEKIFLEFLSNSWIFGFRNEIRDFIKTRKWKYEPPLIGIRGQTPMGTQMRDSLSRRFDIFIDKNGVTTRSLFKLVKTLKNEGKKIVLIEALATTETRLNMNDPEYIKFLEILKAIDSVENVTFVETSDLTPPDSDFLDSGHISTSASHNYSRKIAERLIEVGFPWK